MRTGGYTVQHTLSPTATAVVKQALTVAKRRGHAQVTPLHVASVMLATPAGLLKKACLEAHSHPLQSKALELCFNVALNRLPTTQSNPIIINPNQSHHPSLSNALVAAFKRAQAHQRRGSNENQNQPILALKVEIEQLIISILDDPSVSRVMREAGFSSTQVKNNVEQSASTETSFPQSKENIKPMFDQDFPVSVKPKFVAKARDEDVMSVIDTMMHTKRKNIVVVRECLDSADAIVRGVIDKFEKENNFINGDLRFVQFVSLPLHSLNHLSREEVEDKVKELKFLVKSYRGRGVILYLGDLKWVSDFWSNYDEKMRTCYYSPMADMIMELSKILMFNIRDNGKFWLMGIANFKTYMKCKTGHNSLEALWNLLPLTISIGSLDLTLNLECKESGNGSNEKKLLTCCGECSTNFTREARRTANYGRNNESISSSSLPSWLQQYKEDNSRQTTNDQECSQFGNLCKKWNSICSTLHKQPHFLDKPFDLHSPCISMSSPTSESNKYPLKHHFFTPENEEESFDDPNLITFMPMATKPDLLSNPNSSPNSASCSEASYHDDDDHHYSLHKFKEVNPENFKILVNALEKSVPWQNEVIPEIASTILRCRSGAVEREGKEETWLLFLGADSHGKDKIARELAKVVFGSMDNFIPISPIDFSPTKVSSIDNDQEFISNKRVRNGQGQSFIERFADAIQENPNRVFFVEDLDQIDNLSQMGIQKAINDGRILSDSGEVVRLEDAIVIFSCGSFIKKRKRNEHGQENVNDFMEREESTNFDLNIDTKDYGENVKLVCDIGIMDLVDKQVMFKRQMF